MKIKTAIIPAAGFATRLMPITKVVPKAMLPVVDKPVIHYLVEEAVASGIEKIIIVTGQGEIGIKSYFSCSNSLEAHLAKIGKHKMLEMIQNITKSADISYIEQKHPLGLGHAIYCAREYVGKNEMFAVLLGDDIVYSIETPCLAQLINIFNEYKTTVIGVQRVPKELVGHYGIVSGSNLTERLLKIEDLVEKPEIENAPSNLAIVGRYIIHSDIFNILEATVPGKGGEIQLTDALRILNRTQVQYAYIFEGTNYDVGDKIGYLKASIEFALNHKEIGEDFKKYLLTILEKKDFHL